jgi:hypothetical protein
MDTDFNENTQRLVLKPEYIGGEPIYLKEGNVIKLVFDPINTPGDQYQYYYYNGLYMIFDVIDL